MVEFTIGFTLLLAGIDQGEMAHQDGVSWKELFIREAPQAWERYYGRTARLQGSWSITYRDLSTNKVTGREHHTLKQRTDHVLLLQQMDKTGHLNAVNPKYAFALQRSGDKGEWGVTGIGKSSFAPGTIDDPSYVARWIRQLPYTFGAVLDTLQVTLLDPGFSIKKVSPVTEGHRQLVRVDFQYTPAKNPQKMPLRAGSVLLDRNHSWTIRRLDVETRWGEDAATETDEFEYKDGEQDFPILKKIVQTRSLPSRKARNESVFEFQLTELEIPEIDFRLSAFGFPEPQGTVWEESSRWYLWFIGLAGGSLAVAGYFWYRIQRQTRVVGEHTSQPLSPN